MGDSDVVGVTDRLHSVITSILGTDDPDDVYNAIGALRSGGVGLDDVERNSEHGIRRWETEQFEGYRKKRRDADLMLEKPPEIRDGDQQCIKCGQRKVRVVELQTRSIDEGFTYKAFCYNAACKYIQTL